jgi:hypothetical protein
LGVEVCEEFGTVQREGFELRQHGIEVAVHGLSGCLAISGLEGCQHRLMLGQRQFQPPPGVEQPPHAVEAEARRFGGAADPLITQLVLHGRVEGEVEAVEALEVLSLDGGELIAQVAAQLVDERGGRTKRDGPHGFHLQRTAEEHVLARVRDLDEGHAGPALGHDVDQPLGCKPVHRLAHGKAGHAHAGGDGLLVEEFAGLQVQLHDGLAQGGMHPDGGAAGGISPPGAQEFICHGRSWHANMLARFRG